MVDNVLHIEIIDELKIIHKLDPEGFEFIAIMNTITVICKEQIEMVIEYSSLVASCAA